MRKKIERNISQDICSELPLVGDASFLAYARAEIVDFPLVGGSKESPTSTNQIVSLSGKEKVEDEKKTVFFCSSLLPFLLMLPSLNCIFNCFVKRE